MKEKNTILFVVIVIVASVLAFVAGNQYGKNSAFSKAQNQFGQFGGQNGARRGGQNMMGNTGNRMMNGGLNGGEIIAKDDHSLTLKMRDGGSRIIFFTTSTKVLMSSEGNLNDLSVGKNVTVMGQANPDNSINATSIQLRPDLAEMKPEDKK